MSLSEDDHVVQTLAPDGSDQSLHIRILPRAGRTGDHLTDAHAGDSAPECVAVNGVAIAEHPSRCPILRKGVNYLLPRPHRRGMFRDVEVNDSPALVAEQDQYEEHTAGEGRHGEEVHRHKRGDMIGQKGPPRLWRRAARSPQEPRHCPFRHRDAKLAQFTVNPRRSPQRIRRGHRADERSHRDVRVGAPLT
jgi:hypothetical protein